MVDVNFAPPRLARLPDKQQTVTVRLVSCPAQESLSHWWINSRNSDRSAEATRPRPG
jgi:hypothetical protein